MQVTNNINKKIKKQHTHTHTHANNDTPKHTTKTQHTSATQKLKQKTQTPNTH